MTEEKPLNVIVVVSDTLRTAYLGCYGNKEIHTPNIDRFAADGAVFTRAYPESLPTIPVRRTLHTGRRAFPFRDYRAIPWDIVYLPGWQPMADNESTVAEDLVAAGYHTGFVTDVLPYFAPGMNFTRGFWQWEYIRGQQQDRWKSVWTVDPDRLARIGGSDYSGAADYGMVPYHIANTDGKMTSEQSCTGRTFQWAMQFVQDNAKVPFYLLVDCFDPHEPWEAPPEYYRMYADGSYPGPTVVCTRYQRNLAGWTEHAAADIVAHYCGLVSLVDHWFGRLLDMLDEQNLADRTMVIFTSDHGTNFGDNLWKVIGKPSWALLPGTMHIPLIVRHPSRQGAGKRLAGLRYNSDIAATVYQCTGAQASQEIDGNSLLPALAGDRDGDREYLTCRYGDTVWYRDEKWWVFYTIGSDEMHVFDIQCDGEFATDLGTSAKAKEAIDLACSRILADAEGDLPTYQQEMTDAIGQMPTR